VLPNQRLNLSGCRGRLKGNDSIDYSPLGA
jgi:hypothetical protein